MTGYKGRLLALKHDRQVVDWLIGLRDFATAMNELDSYNSSIEQLKGPRLRGDRTKRGGAVMVEEFASKIFKARKRHIMNAGLNSLDAREQALDELPPYFGVSRSRFEYWINGKAAAQRRKPKEQRAHALRKGKKLFSGTD